MKPHRATGIKKKFGRDWRWEHNYDHSRKGRILLGWRADFIDVTILSRHEQLLHCSVCTKGGQFSALLTVVYGLHTIDDRRPLWTSLFSLAASCTSPWLLAGDFHSVLFSSDRINGALVSTYESRDFATCVEDCELYELKSKGSYFSWTSKGAGNGRVASRIDRGLANSLWMRAFPHVEVDYLLPGLSDHSPLLFQCATPTVERGKPFRFFHVLAEHEHFLDAVLSGWQQSVNGRPMYRLLTHLKLVKPHLKALNAKHFSNLSERVTQCRTKLESIQAQLHSQHSSVFLQSQEKQAVCDLKKWIGVEESIFQQKSRISWRDENTHFFFSAMKSRYSSNRINSLYTADGGKLVDPVDIQNEIVGFYTGLMGTRATQLQGIDLTTMRAGKGNNCLLMLVLCSVLLLPILMLTRPWLLLMRASLLVLMDSMLCSLKKHGL